jgi:peptidoglycan-N-acetylglucosamine deacetylase
MAGSPDITVIFGFDMETDIGSFTPLYEGLMHGTPLLLQLLADKSVPASFFFVAQAARDHPEVLRQVQEAGHEIGCHSLYHETVGKSLFPIPGIPDLLPHEVQPRLELATQWVAEIAGERPVSFRAPRLFGSTAMCNALESLGYIADASYPMYHYVERISPYHPSATDWTQPGELSLIEIPNFADLSIQSHDPYGRDRDQWPLFRTQSAQALSLHVDSFIAYCRARSVPVVLCFYLHPWEFWPMPQGSIRFGEVSVIPDSFITRNCGDYALQQLGLLIDWLKGRGVRFITAAQCAIAMR